MAGAHEKPEAPTLASLSTRDLMPFCSMKRSSDRISHRGEEVAVIPDTTAVGRGETFYKLEHYLPLLEQKPRSVFNAKPVRRSAARASDTYSEACSSAAMGTVPAVDGIVS